VELSELNIVGFKSFAKKINILLNPGITAIVGPNGCGKSNILEAIAFSSAAVNDKLDSEFLTSRGIRVTDPQFMRAAFDKENVKRAINISLLGDNEARYDCSLSNDNASAYSKWIDHQRQRAVAEHKEELLQKLGQGKLLHRFGHGTSVIHKDEDMVLALYDLFSTTLYKNFHLHDFLIYSPENSALRTFEREGQIQPLGINGEGLFKLLKILNSLNKEKLYEIKEKIQLIDWFRDFEIPQNLANGESAIRLQDRYLDADLTYFDQKSSNEGFLFLLFYFTLFISDDTPKFFAIDNIDASLNPKLCSQLTKELVTLAKKHNKQAIFTTHNPAILDGLNLDDDEQRLFVVYRNKIGHTKAKRILKPKSIPGQEPVKLSEAFLRGYIGGLPKNF